MKNEGRKKKIYIYIYIYIASVQIKEKNKNELSTFKSDKRMIIGDKNYLIIY